LAELYAGELKLEQSRRGEEWRCETGLRW